VILFLKILGGVAALALGVYLGMGEFRQTPEEIEARLGTGRRRKAKRHFMWLNYLKPQKRASERRAVRHRFKTATAKQEEETR
jgi:hypothetical protein